MSNDPASEFIKLFEASGWSQTEVAKKLFKSRAAISRFIARQSAPSQATVEFFKKVLADEKPEALRQTQARFGPGEKYPEQPEALVLRDEYAIKMRTLPDEHQRTVETIIDSLASSSAATSRAKATGVSASRAAREHGRGSRPSPPTGGHTSYKPKPGRGTGKRSKDQPPPQGPAPT